MNFPRLNQTKDLALAHTGQDGCCIGWYHLNEGLAPVTESGETTAGFNRNQLFGFEGYFSAFSHLGLFNPWLLPSPIRGNKIRGTLPLILLEFPYWRLGAFLTFF